MSEEIKFTEDDKQSMNEIVTKTRELAKKYGVDSAEYKRYVDESDVKMKTLDEKNEEIVAKLAEEEKKNEELKNRIQHLETIASTANVTPHQPSIKDTEDVMNAMLKNQWTKFIAKDENIVKAQNVINSIAKFEYQFVDGGEKMNQIVQNIKATPDLLRSDIGELGGYLCAPEYSNELNKNMIEYSPLRQYARIKTTGSKIYKEAARVGIPVATRPGEARTGGKSTSTHAMDDYTPVRLTNTTPITTDELLFNNYNLANELMIDNSEAFAVKEAQEFFNGSGVEEGLGFTVDPNVPQYETLTTTLEFSDLIRIMGELKSGYNALFMFNRRTLAYLRLLEDGAGRFIWNGPFGDGASGPAATINGIRYSSAFIEFDDPDVSGGYPILLADMFRFYQIVDRTEMTIIRDEYSRKLEGIVEFTFNKWCVGKPKIKEAGIRMKRKA